MTGAVVAVSRSTRAVRMTIPGRARGGWNFDSGSSNPSLGAVSRSRPDIMSTRPAASGSSFMTYSKVNAASTWNCRLRHRLLLLSFFRWAEYSAQSSEGFRSPGPEGGGRDHAKAEPSQGRERQQVD